MPAYAYRHSHPEGRAEDKVDVPEDQELPTVDTAELDEDVADLLDEIDDVLEENAESFVKGFVQKGGQ